MNIYLVMESDGYETTNVLRSYRSKRRAKEFIKSIDDYLATATYPEYPTSSADEAFDSFISEVDKLNSKHPAKVQTECVLYIEQIKVY